MSLALNIALGSSLEAVQHVHEPECERVSLYSAPRLSLTRVPVTKWEVS